MASETLQTAIQYTYYLCELYEKKRRNASSAISSHLRNLPDFPIINTCCILQI